MPTGPPRPNLAAPTSAARNLNAYPGAPRAPSAMSNIGRNGLRPASQMIAPTSVGLSQSQMNIMQGPVWNPSLAPSPSIMPPAGQKLPNNTGSILQSGMSVAQPTTANQVCKTYNRDRTYFRLGEIIALPFHEPNTNPNLQPGDGRLRLTLQGPVFTKRRMAVILWIHRRDMFCVPLYSFEGRGLNSKSPIITPEYVCLKNHDDKTFPQQGNYPPVVATWVKKPFDPNTAVHLTGGFKVACNGDITFCGRLEEASFDDLLQLYDQENTRARKQRYFDRTLRQV